MKRYRNDAIFFSLRETRFAPVAVLWSAGRDRPGVERILLSRPGMTAREKIGVLFPAAVRSSNPEVGALLDGIEDFIAGGDVRFPLDSIRLDRCSPFQRSVLVAEHAIPRGRVSTYRLLAGHLGNPKAARAVGTALATNPFPIVIPCHRAIRSDGSLGGFQGGLAMKRALLMLEGVAFRDESRVDFPNLHYGGPRETPSSLPVRDVPRRRTIP